MPVARGRAKQHDVGTGLEIGHIGGGRHLLDHRLGLLGWQAGKRGQAAQKMRDLDLLVLHGGASLR